MLFSVVIALLLAGLWIGVAFYSGMTASRARKFVYASAILVLFFAMLFHRRSEVEKSAVRHDLRETNLGEVDLGGSTAKFLLTSFRGPLICGLWWDSTERQARHEFQNVEITYRILTKLQPHFRSPWQYQSHNLAYNMSVEFDQVADKYFWISEGIRWAAQGERTNRVNLYDEDSPTRQREIGDPYMRWYVGFMLQDKMSVSDEVNTHRCFLHLSCLPPDQWDPSALKRNPERLEAFKKSNPQLVRQIRLLKNIPEGADRHLNNELLTFFASHRRLPSLYPEQLEADSVANLAELKTFPVWPETMIPTNPALEPNHDPFEIARTWYAFGQEPLPPPLFDPEADPAAMRFYRMPKGMLSIIFRKQPAMAKSLQGKQLAKDGWFELSQACWQEALQMWLKFGNDNRLEMRKDLYDERLARAKRYFERYSEEAQAGQPPPRAYRDPETMQDFYEFMALRDLENRRRNANYMHWRTVSETNAKDEAIAARRHVYHAIAHRSDLTMARREFEKGLAGWKTLLITPRTLKPERDAAFLAAFAPHGGFMQGFLVQSQELFDRTDFGQDNVVSDEVVEMQDQYLLLRARSGAAGLLTAWGSSAELSQLLGRHLSANFGPAALLMPTGPSPDPFSIDSAERALFMDLGPLDLYILPEYLFKGARFRQALPAAGSMPPPGSQPTRPPSMSR
jgi:hypothetical protein